MRALLEVMRFEIRYQFRSPFFLGAMSLFALIHFLAITGTGIHIDISSLVAINSVYGILQIELVLFVLGMLPILAFVTTAITRDFEHGSAELVFVTPISPSAFLLGKFLGALTLALSIGLAGLLGAMLGTFMPWLDQTRIASFSLLPWAYVFIVFILPGTFVLCAIFLSIAALTRSFALTYATAMAFFVGDILLNISSRNGNSTWVALLDLSARLTVAAETRYWTAVELNSKIPIGLLPQNRLLWLTVASAILLVTLLLFRLDLEKKPFRFRFRLHNSARMRRAPEPCAHEVNAVLSFSQRASFAQLVSQLKMDLSCVFKNPLIWIILALVAASMIGEFQGNAIRVGLYTPLYPLTGLLLPFLRSGMMPLIMLVNLWYSAELIHRERASGVAEIVNAAPFPDWLPIASKTAALCLIVNALMLVAVLTLMALQAAAGYTHFELNLYLKSAFLYNSTYYCMLSVLAVFFQTIAPGKWLGMLLTLGADVGLLSLEPLGFDHVLYGFRIPEAIYTDMNGFGHFTKPVFWLIAYWGAFCVFLLLAAHLFYPRGNNSAFRDRMRDARSRFGAGVSITTALAAIAFVGTGAWIFYNTNVLNEYLTPDGRLQRQADYEKRYGQYEDAPAPSYDSIRMSVDIFPAERRLESSGNAILGNHKKVAIREFVVSLDPALKVNRIAVENATLVNFDAAQGFYLYRFNMALTPGATVKLAWNVTRKNEGFVSVAPDNALVANGTFVSGFSVMPVPGYNGWRKITDNALRRKYGLPSTTRVPLLGDSAHEDRVAYGVDSRTDFEVVVSTSADQIAVAPGVLQKEWRQNERHYFHYKAEEPILPNLAFCSARYEVARDRWHNVTLEIYYDPKHPFNVAAMLETAKRGLEMYSTEFAPYQYSYLRVLEYPRYRTAAKFMPGMIAYSEAIGFVTDLRRQDNADYAVMHELAHMWWGDRIIGAQIQGRQMLNEVMAEYSSLMLFKKYYPSVYTNRITGAMLDAYLNGRSQENEKELPVMYTENQGYLRAKGPLALYALQDIMGREKVHQALRNFLNDYSFQTAPCPTSRDLVNALLAAGGPNYQQLITDLFERIVLYDVQVDAVDVKEIAGGYQATIEITAKQVTADGRGKETEEPLDTWFDVALFPKTDEPLEEVAPSYIEKRRLHSGKQILTIRTSNRPGIVAVDPFHKRIERNAQNNSLAIAEISGP